MKFTRRLIFIDIENFKAGFNRKIREKGYRNQTDFALQNNLSQTSLYIFINKPSERLRMLVTQEKNHDELDFLMDIMDMDSSHLREFLPEISKYFPETSEKPKSTQTFKLSAPEEAVKGANLFDNLTQGAKIVDYVLTSNDDHPALKVGDVVRCNPKLELELGKTCLYQSGDNLALAQFHGDLPKSRALLLDYRIGEHIEIKRSEIVGPCVRIELI